MKKFIRKILSKKKYRRTIAVLAAAVLILSVYTIIGVRSNLENMANSAAEVSKETAYYPEYPASDTTGKDPTLIQRGEYLTKAGDCIACHTNTPKKGAAFAGGLPMPTPFGVIYTPNITPDKETGIGNWTEDQFIKAMRKGISPQGHFYFPAFPYYYFNNITTEDLKAIKAYLDSIPAVKQADRKDSMVKPFNIRFLQEGWRLLFFHPQTLTGYQPNPKQSDEWNRGAYLVEGLGHCAMCHSPSYYILTHSIPLGAPIKKYNLTGAPVQGYLAPNISKSNLAQISTADIVNVFKKDELIGGGSVEGPMKEANHDSLRYLTDSDLMAIATYLKSVQSTTPPKPKSSGGPGAGIYDSYCSGCHATGAGGAPKFGDATAWDTVMKNGANKVYDNAIHGINGMPAKGTCITCTDEQIKQAVDYMVTAAKGGTSSVPSAPPVPVLTMADGADIYNKNCSSCHSTGMDGAPKLGDMVAWHSTVENGFMNAYEEMVTGSQGHPKNGGCPTCSDAQLKAALKYLLQSSSTNNYELW
jgi:cytochrome c5